MKHHIGLTIDAKLLKEIEELRGREKRSTFIEHLIRLGLKAYIKNEKHRNLQIAESGKLFQSLMAILCPTFWLFSLLRR
jgi:metal-responsive CopG/Arc/MetJ family transcriptional regulator